MFSHSENCHKRRDDVKLQEINDPKHEFLRTSNNTTNLKVCTTIFPVTIGENQKTRSPPFLIETIV